MFLHADSEDTDQTGRSLRWAHRSFCWVCHAATQMFKSTGKQVKTCTRIDLLSG